MPTYTVHAPPPKQGETTGAPGRFVFVRDGFHWWAFLLAPLWLLWCRLWLAFLGYVVVSVVLGAILYLLGVPSGVKMLASALVALLVGFEASTLWRWTLTRRRWAPLGFVVADDREAAEQRFFAAWANRAEPKPAATDLPLPRYGAIAQRAPSSDILGLFPESGAGR